MVKKYLLPLSILLNVLLIAYILGRHYYIAYKAERDTSKDSMVTYTFNKYKVFKQRQDFLNLTPVVENDIVFTGNSLIENFPISEMVGRLKNKGVAGGNSSDLIKRIPDMVAKKPAKIFIMEGINDMSQNIPEQKTFENFEGIIKIIKSASPDTKIYIHSILPVADKKRIPLIERYNNRIKGLCAKYQLHYVDLFPIFYNGAGIKPDLTLDGLHLTPKGYALWRDAINQYLQ